MEQVSTLQACLDQGTSKESERARAAEEQADSARQAKLTAEQAQARAESELHAISSDRDVLNTNAARLQQHVEVLEEDIEKEPKRGNALLSMQLGKRLLNWKLPLTRLKRGWLQMQRSSD